jgi:hypothetical protein
MGCMCLLKPSKNFKVICILLSFCVTALERIHGFQLGDSTLEWKKKKWEDFKERLSKVIVLFVLCITGKVISYLMLCVHMFYQLLSLQEPWTLILDDGLAASFVALATDSLEDDSQLTSKLLMNQIHIGEYQRMFTPKFCSKLIVVRWKVNQNTDCLMMDRSITSLRC